MKRFHAEQRISLLGCREVFGFSQPCRHQILILIVMIFSSSDTSVAISTIIDGTEPLRSSF